MKKDSILYTPADTGLKKISAKKPLTKRERLAILKNALAKYDSKKSSWTITKKGKKRLKTLQEESILPVKKTLDARKNFWSSVND